MLSRRHQAEQQERQVLHRKNLLVHFAAAVHQSSESSRCACLLSEEIESVMLDSSRRHVRFLSEERRNDAGGSLQLLLGSWLLGVSLKKK